MAKKIKFKDLFVFENEDYILINKPPFVSSLDERDLTRENILMLAKEHDEELQLCHRIDKETSGILAIAKNPNAYRNLSMQFENRTVSKTYHAVVDGRHEFTNKVVDYPIQQNTKGGVRIDWQEGKFAETSFDTLEVYKFHTLIACKPVTGRMHQIRIHLASLKAHIVADLAYGGKHTYLSDVKRHVNLKNDSEEQPLMQRFALHARQLEFKGTKGEPISVEAPYPKDFRALTNQLGKNK